MCERSYNICSYNKKINVFCCYPLLKRVVKEGLNGAKIMQL